MTRHVVPPRHGVEPVPVPAPACGRRGKLRLWVMSDLNVDRRPFAMPDPLPDFDVLVVAGNVRPGIDASVRWLADALAGRHGGRPVVLVPGNREFWDPRPKASNLRDGRAAAARLGVTLLSDAVLRIEDGAGGGVHVVGSTLWTDYGLHGPGSATNARGYARHSGPDHRKITLGAGRPYWPHDAAGAHARSRAYVEDVLKGVKVASDGFGLSPVALVRDVREGDRAVVVTHHAPSRASLCSRLSPGVCEPWVSASFASDVEDLLRMWGAPTVWVHGHVLQRADHQVGRCRVIANPRTRPGPTDTFDPTLVVEA